MFPFIFVTMIENFIGRFDATKIHEMLVVGLSNTVPTGVVTGLCFLHPSLPRIAIPTVRDPEYRILEVDASFVRPEIRPR